MEVNSASGSALGPAETRHWQGHGVWRRRGTAQRGRAGRRLVWGLAVSPGPPHAHAGPSEAEAEVRRGTAPHPRPLCRGPTVQFSRALRDRALIISGRPLDCQPPGARQLMNDGDGGTAGGRWLTNGSRGPHGTRTARLEFYRRRKRGLWHSAWAVL